MIRSILSVGHPLLRVPARYLTQTELMAPKTQQCIDDLIETMRHAQGAGLAAPQIGWPVQVAAICVENNVRYPYKPNVPLTILVNPSLEALTTETEVINEGCLSVPGFRGKVRRHMAVRVKAWNRIGQPISVKAQGLTAATFQHELDHLKGRLFLDRLISPTSLMTWGAFEQFHRDIFEKKARGIVQKYGG